MERRGFKYYMCEVGEKIPMRKLLDRFIMVLLLTLCFFAHVLRVQSDSVAEDDGNLLLLEEVSRNMSWDDTASTPFDVFERTKNDEGPTVHVRQKRAVPAPKECHPKTEFDCGHWFHKCISMELVCNHQNDCGNWEDEPSNKCFINECLLNNGGCSQICVDDTIGYHCQCYIGYQQIDSRSCIDIDECEIEGSCSQLCHNTNGSFTCSCLEGYIFEPSNRRRCKAQLGRVTLLFTDSNHLRKIDLVTSKYTVVISGLTFAWAVDYDFAKKLVLWSDVTDKTIYSADLETGTSKQIIVKDNIIFPRCLAVDWIHGNVYWTDSERHAISVATLDGKLVKLLFGTSVDEPRAIVVNPLDGWMFWTDKGAPCKIERAGMDGSHRSTIISKGINSPTGLTIDFVSQKIYWADEDAPGHKGFNSLSSSDYDGSNVKMIMRSPNEQNDPYGLDVFEDWLYWTTWGSNNIYKMDKFTGKNLETVASGSNKPKALRVVHSYKQPRGINYCNKKNGGCSHLCLPAPTVTAGSAKYTCACPDGMALTDSHQNCIVIGENVKCTFENGTKTCTCRDGYAEKNGSCEACICNENNKCFFINGTKMCTCKDGYEENNGICEACICKENAKCSIINGTKTCTCKVGYEENNETCEECICNENARCSFINGTKTCTCKDGYEENNGNCEECICNENARCSFLNGTKTCTCKVGYEENNGTCEECICSENARCSFIIGTKTCKCKVGYEENNGTCEECICSENARCSFLNGTKTCMCNVGYEENNGTCEECICNENAKCSFINGTKTCTCKFGYERNNGACEECVCRENAKCSFVNGTRMCTCNDGYEKSNGICEECICNENAKCSFINGTRMCTCKEGYEENNGTCEECDCRKDHVCTFKNGSRTCECAQGYAEINGTCQECLCEDDSVCLFENGGQKCFSGANLEEKEEKHYVVVLLVSLVLGLVLFATAVVLIKYFIGRRRRLGEYKREILHDKTYNVAFQSLIPQTTLQTT